MPKCKPRFTFTANTLRVFLKMEVEVLLWVARALEADASGRQPAGAQRGLSR